MNDTIVNPHIASRLAVGMEALAKIVRLYKKYGGWVEFKPTKTSYSPPRRRIRLECEGQGK